MNNIVSEDEILIGLTAPIGVPLQDLEEKIASFFEKNNFTCSYIKVSSFLIEIYPEILNIKNITPLQRTQFLQNAGDVLRIDSESPEIIALLFIQKIQQLRKSTTGKHVIILRSFKHPQEVELMRHVYRKNFFLIGCSAPLLFRTQHLKEKCQTPSTKEIFKIISNDHSRFFKKRFEQSDFPYHWFKNINKDFDSEELSIYMHSIESTFCLADLFLNLSDPEEMNWILKRFLETLLGYPFHTPTSKEVGMFVAKTMALRSSAIPKQVGAAIMNPKGEIISTGSNEVPKHSGGFYWPERQLDESPEKDARDFRFFTTEPARKLTEECCLEILKIFKKKQKLFLFKEESALQEILKELKQSRFIRMKLFGHRTVHAEMAAIVNAASRGVSIQNQIMYVTAYPCHECTKHLISAGLQEVVYLESYPKSEALRFWPTEVQDVDHLHQNTLPRKALNFRFFTGIAPRLYMEFFSPKNSRETYCEQKIESNCFKKDEKKWSEPSSKKEHILRENCLFSQLNKAIKKFLKTMKKNFS